MRINMMVAKTKDRWSQASPFKKGEYIAYYIWWEGK